jgi:regulation of enolase protein 1 (concanavalin A-like superfamily)
VGDFDFVVQLVEQTDVTDWTKTGIMVRSNLWPTSRNYLFGFSGRRGVIRQRRPADNAETTQERAREDLKGPGWIKLTRRGSNFTGYHSRDGKTWMEVYTEQLEFQDNAIVGLATSSWGAGQTFNVQYDNVSLTQP